MSFVFELSAKDIIEIVMLVFALGFVYIRSIRLLTNAEKTSRDYAEQMTSLNSAVSGLKSHVSANITTISNQVAEVNRRLEGFEHTFVRKDVHDARLQMIAERIDSAKLLQTLMGQTRWQSGRRPGRTRRSKNSTQTRSSRKKKNGS